MPGVGSWSDPSRPWTLGAVVARVPFSSTPSRGALLRSGFSDAGSRLAFRALPEPDVVACRLAIAPRRAISLGIAQPAQPAVGRLQRDVSLAVDPHQGGRPLPAVNEAVVGAPVVVRVEVTIAMTIIAVIARFGAVCRRVEGGGPCAPDGMGAAREQ